MHIAALLVVWFILAVGVALLAGSIFHNGIEDEDIDG